MNTKKFIQILAVSATALITACEEQFTSFEGETPITVSTLVSEKTRAGYDNSNLPSTFVMDIDQEGENYDYSRVTMTQGNGNTYNAPNDVLLLWKGSAPHKGANIKAMTIPNGLSEIDADGVMRINISTVQSSSSAVKDNDLLGAKTGEGIPETIDGNNIAIQFNHLLSKLYVKYEFTELNNVTVSSIKLKNICIEGGYSYKEMNYDDSSLAYGDITMYHNTSEKAAEAIFFPHTPDSKLALEVVIRNNWGRSSTLSCPIDLKNGKSFEGKKQYTMTIRINGDNISDANISVNDWISDSGSMTNKKILWIGTSIPAGENENNYPNIIAAATGFNIVNNSRPASYVCFVPWCLWLDGAINLAEAYCLSATRDEIDAKYRPIANQLLGGNQTLVDQYLDEFKSHSYESLIIPEITGDDPCNVIVIDHGFNDRAYLMQEVPLNDRPSGPRDNSGGLEWLNNLINNPPLPENYIVDSWYKEFMAMGLKQDNRESYIAAMNYVISECKKVNPNIHIIIGNYFAISSPLFAEQTSVGPHYTGEYIIKANQAIAAMNKKKYNNIEIVNIHEYTGFDDESSHDLYKALVPNDWIHPANDEYARLNRIIANAYLEEFRRIFGE